MHNTQILEKNYESGIQMTNIMGNFSLTRTMKRKGGCDGSLYVSTCKAFCVRLTFKLVN